MIYNIILLNNHNQILLFKNLHNSETWHLPEIYVTQNDERLKIINDYLNKNVGIIIDKIVSYIDYTHQDQIFRILRVLSYREINHNPKNYNLFKWHNFLDNDDMSYMTTLTKHTILCLKIPDVYGITNIKKYDNLKTYMYKLEKSLDAGLKFIQFREPSLLENNNKFIDNKSLIYNIFIKIYQLCNKYKSKLLVNSIHDNLALCELSDGIHMRSIDSYLFKSRPNSLQNKLFGISIHNRKDLFHAKLLKADFVILGSVLNTQTHPENKCLGWKNFSRIIQNTEIPVFAIGGQSIKSKNIAISYGAHGIAGMREIIKA